MAIRFRARDFLLPMALLEYRSLFARAERWPLERLQRYQQDRLRRVLDHAVRHVPWYRDLAALRELRTTQGDALAGWPLLSKDEVRQHGAALTADNARRFRPVDVSSTGTTGAPVTVSVDRRTNALEFSFYWRHWSWFGYRLGQPFAQLSWSDFRESPEGTDWRIERGTNRLLLNARALSSARVAEFARAMRRHRPKFLKGHPSALLHMALFLRRAGLDVPPLRAVFTTGEVLMPGARAVLRETFGAPVADAYGMMERTAAACECPEGRMHVAGDYGVLELVDEQLDSVTGRRIGRIVSTGLHSFSMPLVRYDTGDLAEIDDDGPCRCGRTLSTVGRIFGRSVDAVVTPDGRVITAASVVFNAAQHVIRGQLVQHDVDRLHVRILPSPDFTSADEARLHDNVRAMVGGDMRIEIERVHDLGAFDGDGLKHRPVVSTVYQRAVSRGEPLP